MHESMIRLQEWSKRHLVVIALVVLAAAEALSVAAFVTVPSQPELIAYQEEQRTTVVQPTLRISEIRGPQIDDEAAMIVAAEPVETAGAMSSATTGACSTLPLYLWVFLVVAYAALLIFNFSFTFARATKPQWFLEVSLTLLAVSGWYVLDECRTHNWFPFAIVQFGLIVFALYAYLLEKKLSEKAEEIEKTESMF